MIKENSGYNAVSNTIQKKEDKKQKLYIIAVYSERELRQCPIEKGDLVGEMIKGYVFDIKSKHRDIVPQGHFYFTNTEYGEVK